MLKNVKMLLLTGLLITSIGSTTLASTVFDGVSLNCVNEYEKLLKNATYEIEDVSITDMDKDNVPELVVLYENEKASRDSEYIEIYTLENNKAVKIYSKASGNNELDVELTKRDGIVYAVVITEGLNNETWIEYDFLYKNGNSIDRKVKLNYDSKETNNRYKMNDKVINKSLFASTMKGYMDIKNGTLDEYEPRLEMSDIEDVYEIINQAKFEKNSDIIKIYVNGKELKTDSYPVIKNGTTMVPMRDIFEALNSNVRWDATTKSVTATKNNKAIKLTVNSSNAEVNGKLKILNEEPYINEKNATMVPLRFISESLGAEVKWNGQNKTITITM